MTKRSATAAAVVFSVISLLFAQEKKDTTVANSIIAPQQITNKPLAKQTQVYPKKQSNWSKIKDLFM